MSRANGPKSPAADNADDALRRTTAALKIALRTRIRQVSGLSVLAKPRLVSIRRCLAGLPPELAGYGRQNNGSALLAADDVADARWRATRRPRFAQPTRRPPLEVARRAVAAIAEPLAAASSAVCGRIEHRLIGLRVATALVATWRERMQARRPAPIPIRSARAPCVQDKTDAFWTARARFAATPTSPSVDAKNAVK